MISGIATPRMKITKPSSNVPPVESSQSHCWIGFSGDASSSNVRRCGSVIWPTLAFLSSIRFLLTGGLMIFAANLGKVHRWLGKLHVHVLHLLDNDLRNGQIPEPFVVGRNDKPGSVLGARLVQHVLERLCVIIPVVAFRIIRFTDLPLAIGVVQSLPESRKLFLLGNVQEIFENGCVVFSVDELFEFVDLIVAL